MSYAGIPEWLDDHHDEIWRAVLVMRRLEALALAPDGMRHVSLIVDAYLWNQGQDARIGEWIALRWLPKARVAAWRKNWAMNRSSADKVGRRHLDEASAAYEAVTAAQIERAPQAVAIVWGLLNRMAA